MDRTGWVRGGDRSAGQPMQRSGWIRAARYIADESFCLGYLGGDLCSWRPGEDDLPGLGAGDAEPRHLAAAEHVL